LYCIAVVKVRQHQSCNQLGSDVALTRKWTSSSASTKRPCDASCLSVVSVNNIPRAPSFLLLVTSASDASVLFPSAYPSPSLAVINKVHSCVAIIVSVCCDTLYSTVETVDDTSPVIDAKAMQTLVENRDFCLLHLHSVVGRNIVITRVVWLPDVNKSFTIRLLVSTEYTNVTDRRIPHDGMGRAYALHRAAKTIRQRSNLEARLPMS